MKRNEDAQKPVTVMEVASYVLGRDASTGADFELAGMQIIGGCAVCHATLGAHDACPSRSGYWKCSDSCIGGNGYGSVREAAEALGLGRIDILGPAPLTPGEETARNANDFHHGFLSRSMVAVIAADPNTRLRLLLVRCGASRFLAPAYCTQALIETVERDGLDYVRDVSLPVGGQWDT
jgi:hypothetical protein